MSTDNAQAVRKAKFDRAYKADKEWKESIFAHSDPDPKACFLEGYALGFGAAEGAEAGLEQQRDELLAACKKLITDEAPSIDTDPTYYPEAFHSIKAAIKNAKE